ncbi:uncharacterized protein TM35_000281930 [Trypanosoma theileri]|uniref:Uncharacterized protein n=1 Tax=Trypanosoma theileri TaxID=67003 RepID=A0A1X0NP54_9TRYP|nr:uncharacterized protein TM35_000281930 [Trypanosoma theileri]ORC86477.1 hypothetical protein TM35_000281930 [Trypanosoma theileri]
MIFQASRFSKPRDVKCPSSSPAEAKHAAHTQTPQTPQWSGPATQRCPSHSQCTHIMTVSHAHIREALRHSLKCTPSHTPTERKRKTQENNNNNNNNNRIPTAHKALTIHNNHSCHSHQRKTLTHTSTSTQPQKEKKKTDPIRETEAEQSHPISPQRLQSLKQATQQTTHTTREVICSWQYRVSDTTEREGENK